MNPKVALGATIPPCTASLLNVDSVSLVPRMHCVPQVPSIVPSFFRVQACIEAGINPLACGGLIAISECRLAGCGDLVCAANSGPSLEVSH